MKRRKRFHTVRIVWKKANPHPFHTTLRISDQALPAMIDTLIRMYRRGEVKEFGIGGR
jgi:hypothetical protein